MPLLLGPRKSGGAGVGAAPPPDPPGFRLVCEVCAGSRFIQSLDVHRAIVCAKA